MPNGKKESFHNLIDKCISYEEDPELSGKGSDMFKRLLSDYFFRYEVQESKNFGIFLADMDTPDFVNDTDSLLELDIEKLRTYIEGEMINDSLSGTIMLSQPYLKNFYSDYPSSFAQLPEDVKFELIDKIKEKNSSIISSFEKIMQDKEADKKRKVVILIALILKNLHRKTGRPLNKLSKPADEIIKSIFNTADEIFTGQQKQLSDIGDDSNIKELAKTFFNIRQFTDITEIAAMFKEELERFKKRGIKAK